MSDPLIYDIARRVLLLIADAWHVSPVALPSCTGGPRDMAHHFLKAELGLTYAQVSYILNTSARLSQGAVQRGQNSYDSWETYRQRYDGVKHLLLNARWEVE